MSEEYRMRREKKYEQIDAWFHFYCTIGFNWGPNYGVKLGAAGIEWFLLCHIMVIVVSGFFTTGWILGVQDKDENRPSLPETSPVSPWISTSLQFH